MDLLFRTCICLFIKLISFFVEKGLSYYFKRPLFGLPSLCQHKSDVVENLLFKNITPILINLSLCSLKRDYL